MELPAEQARAAAVTVALVRFVTGAPLASSTRHLSGMVGPALARFNALPPSTGAAKPTNWYVTLYAALACAVLPALSVAVQAAVLLPTLPVLTAEQLADATPDIASLAFGVAVALPFNSTELGETLGVIAGAVASRMIVTSRLLIPPALVALQLMVWPGVSAEIVVGAQAGDVTADSASETVQLTVTSLVYQPLLPSVPVTLGVITGGVASDDGSCS